MSKVASTLFVILLPFKNATHILEADNMFACYVAPIINQSLKLLEEDVQFVDVSENIIDSINEKVFERMIHSQSGAYWNFLFSLTPLGRKQLREYPGISGHGTDPIIKPPESLILKEKENQKIIFEKIKQDSNFFSDKGEELINEFNNFGGKLVNFKDSKVLKQHNSTESTSELADVSIDPISLNLLNDEPTKNNAESDFSDDYSEYEMNDSDDDDENETEINPENNTSEADIGSSYGPLATNISILKEIAQAKGYTPEETTLFVTRYTDWITDDSNLLVMHDETLLMGIKCWRYIEYLPYMKSFAKFVIPLLGITSSESHCERAFWKQRRILGDQCTQTSIKVEKARLNYSIYD